MKTLALLLAAAAALAMAAAPADARKRHHTRHYTSPAHAPSYGGYRGGSDPSFGNRAGINRAQATGRCVQDLGYGRYRYCGW